MTIENEFNIGELVYLRTDVDQDPYYVTAILIRPYGILYELSGGTISSLHYEFELSREEDQAKKLKF